MITPERLLSMLEEHTNVLLYGPPGTGKSHLMKQVEDLFHSKYGGATAETPIEIDTAKEREAISESSLLGAHSRWVTFHQGYSYEDFIIGLRPTAATDSDGPKPILSLEAKAGALLELAARTGMGNGLLLIDEINRGNAARIFGEFITLMEPDKRLAPDGGAFDSTVTVTLPYLAPEETMTVYGGLPISRQFQMPQRIYTLASMNSVDKSVAPLDAAIRRRFYMCQLRPTDDDWEAVSGASTASHSVARIAVGVMKKINRGIGLHLGPDYMFGHHYFPSKPKLGEMSEIHAKSRLVSIWRHKILPQVVEFFQARPNVCMSILEIDEETTDSGLKVVIPSNEESDAGGSLYIFNGEANVTDDVMFSYLQKYSSVS